MSFRVGIADELELTDDELAELDTTEDDTMTWYDIDPSDIELARRDAMIARGYRHLAAVLAGATLIAALIVGVGVLSTRDAQAQDLTATRVINDRPYTWILPEAGCRLLRGWEDMSAQAWCPSGLLTYDPDGAEDRDAGVWYVADYTR